MDPNVGKRQLITYSQADLKKFPTRESFGQSLEVAFNAGSGKVNVTHWACSRESHQDGGWHYHCSLKLSGVKKWITVKQTFEQSHRVVLHFSNSHDHYISTYRYMCESDKEAAKEMQRKSTSRMEMIDDAAQGTCANDCIWLVSPLEVLQFNSLNPHTFAGYLKELLTKGRGKWRNLMIIGPTNCAKTFMLKPLNIIFRCFENPSNDKYAWVDADKADCILMQDFRYSKETIA